MKLRLRIFQIIFGLLVLSLFSGCNAVLGIGQEDELQVPQSQPAPWEGQVPGMPTTQG